MIARNLVYDHEHWGSGSCCTPRTTQSDVVPPESEWDIPCAATKDEAPEVEDPSELTLVFWNSTGNRVIGNVVSGSGFGDLGAGSAGADLATLGNCFSGNTFATSTPADLEALAPCAGEPTASDWTRSALDLGALVGEPAAARASTTRRRRSRTRVPSRACRTPESAAVRPASDGPEKVDIDAIAVPAASRRLDVLQRVAERVEREEISALVDDERRHPPQHGAVGAGVHQQHVAVVEAVRGAPRRADRGVGELVATISPARGPARCRVVGAASSRKPGAELLAARAARCRGSRARSARRSTRARPRSRSGCRRRCRRGCPSATAP